MRADPSPSTRVLARRRVLAGAALTVVSVLATACGSSAPTAGPTGASGNPQGSAAASAAPAEAATPTPTPTPTFDRTRYSLDDPASIWVVVDKLRPLNPKDYAPSDLVDVPVPYINQSELRREASDAVVAMFAAAKSESGLTLTMQSAYRPYATQVRVYDGYVKSAGQAGADAQSARPGFSEHQTGLALDIAASPAACTLQACFGQTPQGQWLAANAYRFGFLLRYPADKTAVTGYEYEPWHFRYIGADLAGELHRTGVTTLEEFFGLPAAPDYAAG